ncbi:MAG: TOBE domain-containing protein, partial [Desulfobacterales bacterium]
PYVGREMILGIRPEHCVEYRPHSEASGMADLAVRVDVIEPLGMDTMIHYEFAGKQICSRVNPHAVSYVGETIQLMMDMNRMHFIDPKTDKVVKHDNKIPSG